ncbi:hypothetical protein DFH07DRAFT_243551 [Mycena maculata]|uniref:F-box domain-containing protein n=1 Tax=Mycena maculata TaxID=230809 RepID=A0AAD7HR21_9AGAR|nr:hypothetical protein DFH07DRAFT_243551 [Mycena maculata]
MPTSSTSCYATGACGRTRGQNVDWLKVGDTPEGSAEDEWWVRLLTQSDKTTAEIVKDAWMGPGNMWAFVRPDRFPIAEALAYEPPAKFAGQMPIPTAAPSLGTLPFDIYVEISANLPARSFLALTMINKQLRATLSPHMDPFFFHYILANELYLLPAPEVECYRGSEEYDWWDENWTKGVSSRGTRFPGWHTRRLVRAVLV